MHNNRLTILAINPGTRYLGIAVLKGQLLLDWSVNVITGTSSYARLLKTSSLLSHLIDQYQPDVLVTKKLHPSRCSSGLRRSSRVVYRLAEERGLNVCEYSIQEMEAFFEPEGRINKEEMAELVALRHPALRHDLRKEQDNLNPYHIRMFEAVALGTMAESKISEKIALTRGKTHAVSDTIL